MLHVYLFFNETTKDEACVFTAEDDPPGDFAPFGFRLSGTMETDDNFDGTPPGDGDFFVRRQ